MAAEKSLALILRVVEFSESSCIVTMFTREFGKVSALAKGARRPKSPFESALDLMALCRIVFLHKSSDALDLLTEAKLERRCRLVEKGLPRLYAGYYVVELLNELTHHGDPHPELFDAADRVLLALENGGDVAATVMHFELAALRLLGHSPALLECVGCGESILLDGRIAFGLLAGGVLCDRCRVGRRQVVRISSLALQTMRQLTQTDEVNAAYSVVDPQIRGELRGVLNQYMNNLIGHRPRLQKQLAMLA